MIKNFLWTFVIFWLLPGCVAIYHHPPADKIIFSPRDRVSNRASVTVATPSVTNSVECPLFELPSTRYPPELPDLSLPEYRTYTDVETALALHINEQRRYIEVERRRLERAYRDYKEQCGL